MAGSGGRDGELAGAFKEGFANSLFASRNLRMSKRVNNKFVRARSQLYRSRFFARNYVFFLHTGSSEFFEIYEHKICELLHCSKLSDICFPCFTRIHKEESIRKGRDNQRDCSAN